MASRRRRTLLLAGLLATACLLGGCVYWHLLQLKLQLNHFDKNFAVDTRDGLAITFKDPVLLDEDLETFFKWEPAPDARYREGAHERWHFAWVKEAPASEAGKPPIDVGFDVILENHTLVKVSVPERTFAATMPKKLALGLMRSLGHAQIDEKNRQANSTIDSAALQSAAAERFLSKVGLLAALGRPTSESAEAGLPIWHYEFVPASKEQRFSRNGTVSIHFTLDPATGKVRVMKGRTMFGTINFETANVGPKAIGTVKMGDPSRGAP